MQRPFHIIAVIFLLTLISHGITAADDDHAASYKDRAVIPAHMAPVYNFAGEERDLRNRPVEPVILGPLECNAVGTQIGTTTFDFQHNGSMGRQIEHRSSGFLHFDWTLQTDLYLGGDRGIGYQAYDISTCGFVLPPGGIRLSSNVAGYVNIDADPEGCGIACAHELIPENSFSIPLVYWDSCQSGAPSEKFDYDGPADIYGGWLNDFVGPDNENLWPKIDWQIGTETILHMVAVESSTGQDNPQTFSYYRRIGPYGVDGGAWSAQRVVDTIVTISPIVASSPFSDRVAIVWTAPADYRRDTPGEFVSQVTTQVQNDVWFAVSTNQGADWVAGVGSGSIGHEVDNGVGGGYDANGGNITNYAWEGQWKAYTNVSAIFDHDDNLQIVWNCRRLTDTTYVFRRQSAIFHWSGATGNINPVTTALWDQGGACYAHAWGSDLDKPSISECDGRLYILFTQFGNEQNPCFDHAADNLIINGELYLTGSADGGQHWSTPENLTNSVSPLCEPGECENDYWPTMARYGRVETCGQQAGSHVLDILYINDKHAGGVALEEGTFTINPVMWLTTPCFPATVCDCLVGDANNDGSVNVGDAVYIGNIVFRPGSPGPKPYAVCSGDANFDCAVNVGDQVFIINMVFHAGSPEPPACEVWTQDPPDGCGELH